MNKAMIIGNLGQDPDTRYLPSGDAVTTVSVATNRRWKDKTTGEKKEHVEWHRCVAFGKRAETMAEFLRKGSKVFIEGQLQTRKWDDKDGVTRYSTEIRIDNFEFLDRKEGSDRPPHPASPPYNTGEGEKPESKPDDGSPPRSDEDFDDDIPF
jgi:single-strand DNA-binding protein